MADMTIDGFEFTQLPGGDRLLEVESRRLSECVAYCRRENITGLRISPYHGYGLEDLDFLFNCPHVTRVSMQGGFKDYLGLYSLKNLRKLSADFLHDLNLAAFPALEELLTDWNSTIDEALFDCVSLRKLWLRGYKPKARSLAQMAKLKKLEDLTLIQARISSLEGLETLRTLKRLELSYCRNLADVKAWNHLAETLEELQVHHCKKLDLTQMRALRNLRKAILSACGNVASLGFTSELSRLEFLSFLGTNVLDGDMTPCLRLKYAGFDSKRHYSHSWEDVLSVINPEFLRDHKARFRELRAEAEQLNKSNGNG